MALIFKPSIRTETKQQTVHAAQADGRSHGCMSERAPAGRTHNATVDTLQLYREAVLSFLCGGEASPLHHQFVVALLLEVANDVAAKGTLPRL